LTCVQRVSLMPVAPSRTAVNEVDSRYIRAKRALQPDFAAQQGLPVSLVFP
jgi:hypothetical protein